MTKDITTKAKLVILRHGQTDYNAQHLMTGRRDIPLNKEGEAQAHAAGDLIKDIRFDKVYSSTLSRAFNTAALALKAAGTQPHLQNADGTWQIEPRREIVELDTGDFTGRSRVEDPEIANIYIAYDVRWPNGESAKDVVDRVREFYDADVKPRLMRGENVLIAAHSVVVGAFEIVLGVTDTPTAEKPGKHKKIPNAAPVVYDYENGILKPAVSIKKAANGNVAPVKNAKESGLKP